MIWFEYMATREQIEANRRNALLSTGPKTSLGKAISRLNAFRHGRRAGKLVLNGESRQEMQADLRLFGIGRAALKRPPVPSGTHSGPAMEPPALVTERIEDIFQEPNGVEAQIRFFDDLWQSKRRLHRAA